MNRDIVFLHSGGINNTNTDLDLGGPFSQFEIAINPLNNLFGDVIPEQTENGLIDYRCFYIYNNWETYIFLTPLLDLLSEGANGSDITIGTIQQNEIQRITIYDDPDNDGYIILQTEYGPAFTANMNGSLSNLTTNIEAALQELPFCSTCTATLTTPSLPASPYIDIEFKGEAGKRRTELIQLIANRLISTSGGSFLPDSYSLPSTYNVTGTSIIRITQTVPINEDSYAASGPIYVFNPNTGLYVTLTYSSINVINSEFNLTSPLTFDLGYENPEVGNLYICYDEVFVPTIDKSAKIKISKISEGSPINTLANLIQTSITAPSGVSFSTSDISLDGSMFPQEGMPIWVKRVTSAGAIAAQNDFFELQLTGTLISP